MTFTKDLQEQLEHVEVLEHQVHLIEDKINRLTNDLERVHKKYVTELRKYNHMKEIFA